MGWHTHHAIIVTSFDGEMLRSAHYEAIGTFTSGLVTDISPPALNGFRSFAVLPDGSKEEWSESDEADGDRASFIFYLHGRRHPDGSSNLSWVEVSFGGDDPTPKILRHSKARP